MIGPAPQRNDLALPERAGRSRRARSGRLGTLFVLPGAVYVVFIVGLPLVALTWRVLGAGRFVESVSHPLVTQALWLSFVTASASTLLAVVLGTPLAYLLARSRFAGKRFVDTLVDLPIVLPPVVAGVALLMAFGRFGLIGRELSGGFRFPLLGLQLPALSLSFTTTAVVLAQLFVAAPFYIRAARTGFATSSRATEEAAALDGATSWEVFRLVTVPLTLPSLASGTVLTWARATGEFGATLVFAGNFPGSTQTMPLAIVAAMESDLDAALALAALLVLLSFAVLLGYRLLGSQRGLDL